MARTYKQPSLVSGMTVNDILNMDEEAFNKLNLSDMRKVVGRLVSAGNKRLRTFAKYGEKSPAERYINKRSGGAFSTKGKNLNQLKAEYMRAKGFLTAKTGTVKGWRKIKKNEIEKYKILGIEMTEETYDLVWQTYEKLKETDGKVVEKKFKYFVIREIVNRAKKEEHTIESLTESMRADLDELYEKMKNNEIDVEGTESDPSSFFERVGENVVEKVEQVAEKVAGLVSKVIPK